jgi:MAF protein
MMPSTPAHPTAGRWLCLVSASPRRRDLLALFGMPMGVRTAHGVDETPGPGETPEALVRRLSRAKARAVADGMAAARRSEPIVVAADTIVALDGAILGKPDGLKEAFAVLQRLRGRTHQVYTGVTVIDLTARKLVTDIAVTDVPMRDYTDVEIEVYVASGDPLDKAGSYAIQHHGFHPVENLVGCYANVMGLPLCHLARILRRLGLAPGVDVPRACHRFTGYESPVAEQILATPVPVVESYPPET